MYNTLVQGWTDKLIALLATATSNSLEAALDILAIHSLLGVHSSTVVTTSTFLPVFLVL